MLPVCGHGYRLWPAQALARPLLEEMLRSGASTSKHERSAAAQAIKHRVAELTRQQGHWEQQVGCLHALERRGAFARVCACVHHQPGGARMNRALEGCVACMTAYVTAHAPGNTDGSLLLACQVESPYVAASPVRLTH